MIDLHAHILPRMDDGSNSVEMSLAMLEELAAMGVTTVCATPHFYAQENNVEDFCAKRAAAYKRLAAALLPGQPQILLAAEVAYFPEMEKTDLSPLYIQGSSTLLLEMPFSEWTERQVEAVESLVLDRHEQVVLVHPERFCFSKGNRRCLELLAQLPLAMQVNASSLMRWRTRTLALELLCRCQIPLLASDCHDLKRRPPNLKGGRSIVERKLGAEFLAAMDENARRLTTGGFAPQ